MSAPVCPYCNTVSMFYETSTQFYGGRNYGPVYACVPCEAWVGCHRGTRTALGRLANKELRGWKIKAHAVLDPVWRSRKEASGDRWSRAQTYKFLAEKMGIARKDCHIGMFSVEQCKRAIEILTPILNRIRDARLSGRGVRVRPRPQVQQEIEATP